jgi:hypothetical protein
MTIALQFRLQGLSRYDEQAGVFVGYIPALRVFSQAESEEELTPALVSAAQMFISTCYEKGILETVLKERSGMTRAVGDGEVVADEQDYIAVSEYKKTFPVDVPLNLVAQQQEN